jgi:hypothetical protein
MKKFFSKGSKLWMFVTLAMLSALVTAGTGTSLAYASSSQVQVPFMGSISGTVAFTSPTTAVLSASGVATHLGRTTYAGNVSDITLTPTGLTNVLVETLTAANGDTLTFYCTEVAVETSPGVYQATDQWVVIGGTGRFEGATGQGTADTHVDLNNGTFTKQVTGTISAPNGK